MIDRMALFKLAPEDATPARRAAIAARVLASLRAAGIEATVGTPADPASAKSWDLAVVVHGPDLAAVDAVAVPAMVAEAAGRPVEFEKGWRFERA